MILYDRQIEDIQASLEAARGADCRALPVSGPCSWPDEGRNQLIFGSDMAYELGGDMLPAVGGVAVTERRDLVAEDEILLYGKDLAELSHNSPYARIALVRVREGCVEDKDSLYRLVRALEYIRYHLHPKGYMLRISALKNRESVRVRRSDLSEGLSFEKVGGMFLEAYHKLPEVEAVRLIFSTDPALDYDRVRRNLDHSESITQALDHLVNKVNMDCDTCHLQDLCQEVEALSQSEKEKA